MGGPGAPAKAKSTDNERGHHGQDSERKTQMRRRGGPRYLGLRQEQERDQRGRTNQAGTDEVGQSEPVGQRIGHRTPRADQVARVQRGQRDKQCDADGPAHLARGVHQIPKPGRLGRVPRPGLRRWWKEQ